MKRLLISFDDRDRSWLERKAKEYAAPMSEIVREAVRQAQQAEQKPLKELLASTKGVWKHGDALKYQRRVRSEWR